MIRACRGSISCLNCDTRFNPQTRLSKMARCGASCPQCFATRGGRAASHERAGFADYTDSNPEFRAARNPFGPRKRPCLVIFSRNATLCLKPVFRRMDSSGSLFQDRLGIYPPTIASPHVFRPTSPLTRGTSRRSGVLFFLIGMPGMPAEMTFLNESIVLSIG